MPDLEEIEITWKPKAIGIFNSKMKNRYDAPRQASLDGHSGTIKLYPKNNYEQALKDLEGIERIWVIYLFHLNQDHWKPMVNPPRNPNSIKRGVFSTRAPYRPNPIGMSCVKLDKIKGLTLHISELDLLDNTPILDIKPYIPYADSFSDSHTGWLEGMEQNANTIKWDVLALDQSKWLEDHGLLSFEGYVLKQLEYQPLSTRHKRVRKLENLSEFSLGYRTWRIKFRYTEKTQSIQILSIHSGYSHEELEDLEDKYQDKELHKSFILKFKSNSIGLEQRL